nr:hypothetical protein [Anaerolineae bacterium]
MTSRRYAWLVGLVVVTLTWSLLLIADIMPALRGPLEWRWPYELASDPGRIATSGLAFVVYLTVASWLLRHTVTCTDGPRRRWIWAVVVWALIGTPLIQVAVVYLRHPDVLRELFERTVSLHSGGYFSAVAEVENINDYLRNYPALMPDFPIHPKRHPPGIPLMFWLARQVFALAPNLARRVALPLRGFQCDNLWLQYLSDPQIASAWASMALPGLAGLTVLPLYRLGCYLLNRRLALVAVVLYPLLPSVGLFATMWDQFIPLFTALGLLWFIQGLEERRLFPILAAGLAISLGTFFNLGVVIGLAILGLYGLFWHAFHRPLDLKRIALEGIAFAAGLAGVWVIYWLFWGVTALDVWRVAMSFHLKMARSYWLWFFFHLYDFLFFLGIPLICLLAVGLWRALRHRSGKPICLLTLAFVLGLLVIDLSGTARGEVARVWLFLVPWALLIGVQALSWSEGQAGGRVRDRWQLWPTLTIVVLLGLQLFAAAVSLRVIHTRYQDRLRPVPTVETLPAQARPLSAQFDEGIELIGYEVKPALGDSSAITLTLYWRTDARIGWPWTVFRHVLVDGQLVGQCDSHPAQDTWPTTCWSPGEIVVDSQEIPLDVRRLGGATLKVGLYDAETGRRLSVVGEQISPEGNAVEIALSP